MRREKDALAARALHVQAIQILESLEKQHLEEAEYSMALAGAYLNLGMSDLIGPRPEDALVVVPHAVP